MLKNLRQLEMNSAEEEQNYCELEAAISMENLRVELEEVMVEKAAVEIMFEKKVKRKEGGKAQKREKMWKRHEREPRN